MVSIFIGVGIMLVTTIVMLIGTVIDANKSEKRFWIKKIIDILVAPLSYFAFIAIYNAMIDNKHYVDSNTMLFCGAFGAFWGIAQFHTFVSQIPMFKKYIEAIRGKGAKAMVISVIVGMFFSIAEIYFSLYIINNSWFVINETISGNIIKTAFEFIYFTFAVTITYSGAGIEIVGIIPKLVQILHILFFYFLLVKQLSN